MNPDIKREWVEALRSGKYRQTRGKLKSSQGAFCCLGVLCDIRGRKWKWLGDGVDTYEGNGDTGSAPEVKDAGIPFDQANYLADLNDGAEGEGLKQHSFFEIADWIEANL